MGVDQFQPVQDFGLDDPPVRHHHTQLGGGCRGIFGSFADGQAELERGRLDRARPGWLMTAATLVGPSDDDGDLVAGSDYRPQGGGRRLGRA